MVCHFRTNPTWRHHSKPASRVPLGQNLTKIRDKIRSKHYIGGYHQKRVTLQMCDVIRDKKWTLKRIQAYNHASCRPRCNVLRWFHSWAFGETEELYIDHLEQQFAWNFLVTPDATKNQHQPQRPYMSLGEDWHPFLRWLLVVWSPKRCSL